MATASAGNREPSPAFMACTDSPWCRRLGTWCWLKGNPTATRYGPTAPRPLAFRELLIGVRIAMRGISMVSRQSTSSWSPIAVATPFKSGCRVQVSGIGRS